VDPAQLALLRAKRFDRIQMKELPDAIIRDLTDSGHVPPELDPYA
jgi:hypothetical protein